jgi:hypothetical protein
MVVRLTGSGPLYKSIPRAQLAVVPGSSHALPMERPDEAVRIIEYFLRADLPPRTLLPVDRAGSGPNPS